MSDDGGEWDWLAFKLDAIYELLEKLVGNTLPRCHRCTKHIVGDMIKVEVHEAGKPTQVYCGECTFAKSKG